MWRLSRTFLTASLGEVSWGSRQLRMEGWKFTNRPPCLQSERKIGHNCCIFSLKQTRIKILIIITQFICFMYFNQVLDPHSSVRVLLQTLLSVLCTSARVLAQGILGRHCGLLFIFLFLWTFTGKQTHTGRFVVVQDRTYSNGSTGYGNIPQKEVLYLQSMSAMMSSASSCTETSSCLAMALVRRPVIFLQTLAAKAEPEDTNREEDTETGGQKTKRKKQSIKTSIFTTWTGWQIYQVIHCCCGDNWSICSIFSISYTSIYCWNRAEVVHVTIPNVVYVWWELKYLWYFYHWRRAVTLRSQFWVQ